jgi:hypothetical protein
LSIYDFLLGYVIGDDAVPPGHATLRTEVERHRDRTMTVVFRDRIETVTRCGTCHDEVRPCTALRLLALPYAEHPAYRSEWLIAPPEARDGTGVVSLPRGGPGADDLVPGQRGVDLPPPGNARRRILRQYGISFQQSDFTDAELAQRGIVVEPLTRRAD